MLGLKLNHIIKRDPFSDRRRSEGLCYIMGKNIHDAWRCHQMETFSVLLVLCAGNSPVTGEFPAQRPVTRSFDVFSICVWINGWANNRDAGDLEHYRAHYDIIVMGYSDKCPVNILDLYIQYPIRHAHGFAGFCFVAVILSVNNDNSSNGSNPKRIIDPRAV